MKVCDRHRDRQARETIHVVGDDTWVDLCSECKTEVLMLLASEPVSPSATSEAPAPRRVHTSRGN